MQAATSDVYLTKSSSAGPDRADEGEKSTIRLGKGRKGNQMDHAPNRAVQLGANCQHLAERTSGTPNAVRGRCGVRCVRALDLEVLLPVALRPHRTSGHTTAFAPRLARPGNHFPKRRLARLGRRRDGEDGC